MFRIRLAEWDKDEATLRAVRHAVFVVEQRVPAQIEWDGSDENCRHAIAEDAAGNAIGCGRLLPDGHIGRLAVSAAWRGRSVGGALLERLIALARECGHRRVVLNAQTHALAFYERHGFAPVGDAFEEAGITHQPMQRFL